MYCHLKPPDVTAFPIQHLSRLRIWAADKSNLESLWGATLMLVRGCLMDWHGTKWWEWGKVRSHLKPFVDQSSSNFWTMQETLRTFQRPSRLSMSRFVQKIFAIRCRSRRKTEQLLKFIGPHYFLGRRPQLFCSKLLARFTVRRLAKCGWVLFAISVCEAWQWSRMQNL